MPPRNPKRERGQLRTAAAYSSRAQGGSFTHKRTTSQHWQSQWHPQSNFSLASRSAARLWPKTKALNPHEVPSTNEKTLTLRASKENTHLPATRKQTNVEHLPNKRRKSIEQAMNDPRTSIAKIGKRGAIEGRRPLPSPLWFGSAKTPQIPFSRGPF